MTTKNSANDRLPMHSATERESTRWLRRSASNRRAWKGGSLLLTLAVLSVTRGTLSQKPPTGGAIRVYNNFDSLGKNTRFVPQNGKESSLFSERVVKVFKNPPIRPKYEKPAESDVIFAGDFGMEFCSSLDRLFESYFSELKIENLNKPWRIFTKNWTDCDVAEHFGINPVHLDDHLYSYLLVRIRRIHDGKRIAGSVKDLERDEAVGKKIDSIAVNDNPDGLADVTQFISSVGSHYVRSYTTGNSLFQVLVYPKIFFDSLKNVLYQRRLADLSRGQRVAFDAAYYNFEHNGTIKTASGNRSVEAWAVENVPYENGNKYNDLLNSVWQNEAKLRRLNQLLQDEVILQLNLRSVAPLFKEPQRRNQFLEMIKKYFENGLGNTREL
ncbi:torso-like protein [Venturia canescens]|uniref:torso-like protein n=1 Tax=Venturia canescens TaxID=32260 RepID=UPI001C9D61BB|nr:torso-like protein [Venturia canescens]